MTASFGAFGCLVQFADALLIGFAGIVQLRRVGLQAHLFEFLVQLLGALRVLAGDLLDLGSQLLGLGGGFGGSALGPDRGTDEGCAAGAEQQEGAEGDGHRGLSGGFLGYWVESGRVGKVQGLMAVGLAVVEACRLGHRRRASCRAALQGRFRPSWAGYFSLLVQREVTKRKHAPTSGSDRLGAIRLPSLRCRSGGRQRRAFPGPTLPCAAVLAAYLLRNTSTRPPVGDPKSESTVGLALAGARLRFLCNS